MCERLSRVKLVKSGDLESALCLCVCDPAVANTTLAATGSQVR